MHSDFQDWSELGREANETLENKILGVDAILQLIIKPSSNDRDDLRIDLIKNSNDSFHLEKLVWRKELDHTNLNNPMKKIKLFGRYTPTFERESIMLNDNSKMTLLNLVELLVRSDKEFNSEKKTVVLEGVHHKLSVKIEGKEIFTQWNILPSHWKIIPTLVKLLLDLSGSSHYDE